MKTFVSIIAAIVFALAVMPANAASKYKRHTKAATAPQQQIACTVVGCIPVPRGCHPEMGYSSAMSMVVTGFSCALDGSA